MKIHDLVARYVADLKSLDLYSKRVTETKIWSENNENDRFLEIDKSSINKELQSEIDVQEVYSIRQGEKSGRGGEGND